MRTFAMHYKPTPIILNDFFCDFRAESILASKLPALEIYPKILEFFLPFWNFS